MDEELWREWPQDPRILVSNKGNVIRYKKGVWLPLKVSHNNDGYQQVSAALSTRLVHRLVAETWIDNPDPDYYTQVNHVDGNKDNNRADNLEWVTPSENIRHSYRTGLNKGRGRDRRLRKGTPVLIVETGEIFESVTECARRIGGHQSAIWHCLAGRRSTHLGYHFEYA